VKDLDQIYGLSTYLDQS